VSLSELISLSGFSQISETVLLSETASERQVIYTIIKGYMRDGVPTGISRDGNIGGTMRTGVVSGVTRDGDNVGNTRDGITTGGRR